MRKEFRTKLKGNDSRADASAYFTQPFDTRDVWGKAKVPVKVTVNGYTWRSTVGNRGGHQYVVVNAEALQNAVVQAGDVVTITLEPDTEKREIDVPIPLQRALGTKLTQKLNGLSFTHKKEFINVVLRSEEGRHPRPPSREDEADALGWKGHQLKLFVFHAHRREFGQSFRYKLRRQAGGTWV